MDKSEAATVEALGRAHAVLLDDLRRLEGAAAPASREATRDLRARLGQTRIHIADHFRFEEQNDYLEAVRQREPHLDRAIHQLEAEHRQLEQSLDALVRKAGDSSTLDATLREEVRAWIMHLRQHETHENDLVQDCFCSDVSAED